MFISYRLSNRHIFLLELEVGRLSCHVSLQVRELCSSESSRCIFHESCSLVTFGHRIGDIWFALWSWDNLRRVSAISGFFTLLLFIHTIYTIRIMMVSRCTRYHDYAIVSFTLDSFTIILIHDHIDSHLPIPVVTCYKSLVVCTKSNLEICEREACEFLKQSEK